MKDILEIAYAGECKNPVLTDDRGKHFFCAEPTRFGQVYCDTCGRRMNNPTRHFVDNENLADVLAGRNPNRQHTRPAEERPVPVTDYIRRNAREVA